MMSNHLDGFMPVLIIAVVVTVVVFATFFISKLISPQKPSELKETPYECGEQPEGTAWSMFNIRFYVVGLIFIIFDVESVLMFPVVSIFKKFNEMGRGGLILIEILIFITILVSGMAYCWKKGDLDWVRSFQIDDKRK